MEQEKKSFEASLARLEELVRALESGALTLDESLKLYEEGVGLVRACNEELDRTEAKIKILKESPDGAIKAADFTSEVTEA